MWISVTQYGKVARVRFGSWIPPVLSGPIVNYEDEDEEEGKGEGVGCLIYQDGKESRPRCESHCMTPSSTVLVHLPDPAFICTLPTLP